MKNWNNNILRENSISSFSFPLLLSILLAPVPIFKMDSNIPSEKLYNYPLHDTIEKRIARVGQNSNIPFEFEREDRRTKRQRYLGGIISPRIIPSEEDEWWTIFQQVHQVISDRMACGIPTVYLTLTPSIDTNSSQTLAGARRFMQIGRIEYRD